MAQIAVAVKQPYEPPIDLTKRVSSYPIRVPNSSFINCGLASIEVGQRNSCRIRIRLGLNGWIKKIDSGNTNFHNN